MKARERPVVPGDDVLSGIKLEQGLVALADTQIVKGRLLSVI